MDKVYMLWVTLQNPPWSVLVGVFADRESAEKADHTTKELGHARHYLHPDKMASSQFSDPKTISEVDLVRLT